MANSKPTPVFVGYARVSTDGQTLDQQRETLKRAGASKIFAEKQSGAKTDRKELGKALAALLPGDVLIVTRLDRLARSTRDLLNVLHVIAEKGAGFRSLADQWADTTTAAGRMMITFLAGIAEFERELIRARTGEGRKRAKDRGVKFGAPFKLTLHQRREALARLEAGQTQAEIGRLFNVDATTVGRVLKRAEEREAVHHLPRDVQRAFGRAGLR